MAFSDTKRHVMNVIDSPPPESFAPDPTPTALDLAIMWTQNAKSWLIVWRQSRNPHDLRQALASMANANRMAVKASQDGGAR